MNENKPNTHHTPKKSHPGLLDVVVFGTLKIIVIHVMAFLFLLGWFLCEWVRGSQQVVLENLKTIVYINVHSIETSQSLFKNPVLGLFVSVQQKAVLLVNYADVFGFSIVHESLQLIVTIIEILVSRFILFLMALPLFVLVLLVCFTDGLVKRDIRKFQGARESTLIFHRAKRFLGLCFFIPLFVYLACPWSIAPIWFLGSQLVLLGLMMTITMAHFKKYL